MADQQNQFSNSDLSFLEGLCNSIRTDGRSSNGVSDYKTLHLFLQRTNLTQRRGLPGVVADVWDDFREQNYPRASRFLFLDGIPTTDLNGTYGFRFESQVEAENFESVIYNLNSREAMGRSIASGLLLGFSFPARTTSELLFSMFCNISLAGGFFLLKDRALRRFKEVYLPRADFHSPLNYDFGVISEVVKPDYYLRYSQPTE